VHLDPRQPSDVVLVTSTDLLSRTSSSRRLLESG